MNPIRDIDTKYLIMLSLLLFAITIAGYEYVSYMRHLENPMDKLFPHISDIVSKFIKYATVEDKRTGDLLLWKDTFASLKIFFTAITISLIMGTITGILMGLYSVFRGLLLNFVIFLSIVPPLAILPILLISFGVGFESKIALIIIGTYPIIALLIYQNVKQINKEEIIKALTLGVSSFQLSYKVIFQRSIPSILEALRVANGMGWLLLIAAEAISAKEGLGYRIYLVRRFLAMDVIFGYVLWIVFLAFIIDITLKMIINKKYPWFYK